MSEIAGYKNLDMCKHTLKAICTKINGVREKRQMFHFCKRNYLFYKVFFFCFFYVLYVVPMVSSSYALLVLEFPFRVSLTYMVLRINGYFVHFLFDLSML